MLIPRKNGLSLELNKAVLEAFWISELRERIFGRGCTTRMILLTCLIAVKRLPSYPTREDKFFTLLHCSTTQLIQYVPIHNKNPVTSWQCFENMHIFNADMLSAKLQHRTPVLTARTVSLSQLHWYWHL